MSSIDTQTAERLTNGAHDGVVIDTERATPAQPEPLPCQVLGAKTALLVAAIAQHLPEELAPQSRYQVAVDLAKTIIGSQLAQALAP